MNYTKWAWLILIPSAFACGVWLARAGYFGSVIQTSEARDLIITRGIRRDFYTFPPSLVETDFVFSKSDSGDMRFAEISNGGSKHGVEVKYVKHEPASIIFYARGQKSGPYFLIDATGNLYEYGRYVSDDLMWSKRIDLQD